MTALTRGLTRARSILLEEAWAIGVVDRPLPDLLELDGPLPVRWLLIPDRHRYFADPFGVPGEDRLYCEIFTHADGIGRLAEVTLGASPVIHPCPLPLPGHLSYPFLFEEDGTLYCLPESSAAGRNVLFRREGAGWVEAAELLPGIAAADTTLFRWQGRYWLAWSDVRLGAMDSLCLAWSDSLTGRWRFHPQNPVKREPSSSRPAGTPFVKDGVLYRPAQDCSRTYGGAVVINRVLRLDAAGFAEEPAIRIPPPPGPFAAGLHTLSAWGERTLVDAKAHRPNPVTLRRKVLRRLRSLAP